MQSVRIVWIAAIQIVRMKVSVSRPSECITLDGVSRFVTVYFHTRSIIYVFKFRHDQSCSLVQYVQIPYFVLLLRILRFLASTLPSNECPVVHLCRWLIVPTVYRQKCSRPFTIHKRYKWNRCQFRALPVIFRARSHISTEFQKLSTQLTSTGCRSRSRTVSSRRQPCFRVSSLNTPPPQSSTTSKQDGNAIAQTIPSVFCLSIPFLQWCLTNYTTRKKKILHAYNIPLILQRYQFSTKHISYSHNNFVYTAWHLQTSAFIRAASYHTIIILWKLVVSFAAQRSKQFRLLVPYFSSSFSQQHERSCVRSHVPRDGNRDYDSKSAPYNTHIQFDEWIYKPIYQKKKKKLKVFSLFSAKLNVFATHIFDKLQ